MMSQIENRHRRTDSPERWYAAARAGVCGVCLAVLLYGVTGCSSTSQSSPPSPPSSMPPSMPTPPGSSTPSGSSKPSQTPSSSPGKTSDSGQQGSQPPSSQPPSGSQPPGGASGGGETSSYELPDLGGAPGSGVPESDSGTAGKTGESGDAGDGGEPGWEEQPAGGEDGWETSNQLPGGETADIPPMPTERGGASGGTDGEGGRDAALDEALKDFDGEILAEREVIRERANETAGSGPVGEPGGGAGETGSASSGAGQIPGAPPGGTAGEARGGPMGIPGNRSMPPPPGPSVAGAAIPDDIPDAKDDDIIARQLREAAMQETDPELKEKLWDEYRRYKGI